MDDKSIRALAHETADIADMSAASDLPALIEGACKTAMLATLRDPIVRAALYGYINDLRDEMAEHPDRDHREYLAKAIALALV